jgi:hypothetical protein
MTASVSHLISVYPPRIFDEKLRNNLGTLGGEALGILGYM